MTNNPESKSLLYQMCDLKQLLNVSNPQFSHLQYDDDTLLPTSYCSCGY